ncbi:hypothetical protein BaRGS_00032806, partial [Batillaria attramentaria]
STFTTLRETQTTQGRGVGGGQLGSDNPGSQLSTQVFHPQQRKEWPLECGKRSRAIGQLLIRS